MELRAFAERVLNSEGWQEKCAPPEGSFTDDAPGSALRPERPAREPSLVFCGRRETPPMPHPNAFADLRKRGIAHHIMANHELQALEVMAFVLVAFPEAPAEFRRGLAGVMKDEQRHTRWHAERGAELGVPFGSLPVNGYFWNKALEFGSVLDYIAGLPLTFEGRNLDHTLEFETYFESAGDTRGAGLFRAIHRDEIRHVAFGLEWLRRLKDPAQTDFEAYASHLKWPLRPEKSRGKTFHAQPRRDAGMDEDFLQRLAVEEAAE
jgi:uncharacterized ferritin-like protein (DUF455 family)